MPATPRARLLVAAWLAVSAVLGLLAAFAWRAMRSPDRSAVPRAASASATPAPTPTPFGEPISGGPTAWAARYGRTPSHADGYPGPRSSRPPLSTAEPTSTASPTPDIRGALPSGAVVDSIGPWRDEDALVAAYRLDGGKEIAVVTSDGRRLLWDSRAEPSLPRHAAKAYFAGTNDTEWVVGDHVTVIMDDVGAVVQLGRGDDGVVHRRLYRLDSGDVGGYASQRIVTINRGVEGVPHTVVGVYQGDDVGPGHDALVVYGDGDVPPVLGRFAAPLEVRDVDGDGMEEIVQVDEAGGRTIRRAGDAYASAHAYPDPSAGPSTAPTPVVVAADDGALPPLPAGLCLQRDGGIACWPKEGGPLRVVWAPGDDGWRLDARPDDYTSPNSTPHGFTVVGDGRWVVMAQVHGAEGTPDVRSRLVVLDRRTGEQTTFDRTWGWTTDAWDRSSLWSVDAALTRLVYVELGVRADGRPAVPGDGVVYRVDFGHDGDRLAPGRRQVVTTCPGRDRPYAERRECRGVLLSPDARLAALKDGDGVWIVDATTGKRVGGVAHVEVPTDEVAVRYYEPAAWSMDGGRLHLRVFHWEGTTDAVLDVATSRLFEVPDSTTWESLSYSAFDDQGHLIHAQFESDGAGLLSRMGLDPEREATSRFADGSRGIIAQEEWRSPLLAVGPMLFNPFDPIVVGGEVRFGLQHGTGAAAPELGVFAAVVGDHPSDPRRLIALPALTPEDDTEARRVGSLNWTPKADGFFYWDSDGDRSTALIGALDGPPRLYDVAALMEGVHGAVWER